MTTIRIIHGDCFDKLRDLPEGSVGAVVSDPPYGLEFQSGDYGDRKRMDFVGQPTQMMWVGTMCSDGPAGLVPSTKRVRGFPRQALVTVQSRGQLMDGITRHLRA